MNRHCLGIFVQIVYLKQKIKGNWDEICKAIIELMTDTLPVDSPIFYFQWYAYLVHQKENHHVRRVGTKTHRITSFRCWKYSSQNRSDSFISSIWQTRLMNLRARIILLNDWTCRLAHAAYSSGKLSASIALFSNHQRQQWPIFVCLSICTVI